MHGHPGGSVLGRAGAAGVLDLAAPLQRAGFNVVTFNFRGAWGSGGSYGFPQRIDDVKAALEFVRSGAAVPGRPELTAPTPGLSGYTEGDFLREIATNQPRFDGSRKELADAVIPWMTQHCK